MKVSHVGLFEIQILIVLPYLKIRWLSHICEHALYCCFVGRIDCDDPSTLALGLFFVSFFFFLRLIRVKISLAVEQICKMFLSGES